jgi:Superfamily II helicase
MNKQEYWSRTYNSLNSLIKDPLFRNNLSQVRARATQEELSSEPPEFNFDPQRIWKSCDYILSESALLLREGAGEKETLLKWIGTAAQAFEFLSKIATQDDKENLLLNSAICYHIAGFQANALCITRLIEKNISASLDQAKSTDELLIHYFRRAVIGFLKRDVAGLRGIIEKALTLIHNLQGSVLEDIENTDPPLSEIFNLTAHAYLHTSISAFSRYCLFGVHEDFLNARESIERSHDYFQKTGEITLGTLASELRTVFDLFIERSTWNAISQYAPALLKDRIWHAYLRNLAFDHSIVEFWQSQLKGIRQGLLSANDGFVIQMPTSAGKTLTAELSILAALTENDNARCLYIAPYRALVSEIEKKLSDTLGAVGFRVSNLIGGFEFDAFEDFLIKDSDVLVATPEKVELLLRTHPEFFEQLAVIVIDEGHILDEGIPSPEEIPEGETLLNHLQKQGSLGRGALLELLITRLRLRLPETRFIFLSAVMPEVNASDFVKWLSKNSQEPVRIDTSERPSRQLIGKFTWRSEKNGRLDYINLPDQNPVFVPYFVRRKQYKTGRITPTGRMEKRTWPDIANKAQTTAVLAARFAESGPVLVFCAQPGQVKTLTENLITSLQLLEASGELTKESLRYVEQPDLESYHLAYEWLGENHPLTRGLQHGVGLHYGPLPDPVRQAVEDDFKKNRIHLLVSTNTLGQGVNLPIKTVIIYSLERRWGQGPENTALVKKRDFWNICGRAGRAGKETEGQIIFVVISDGDRDILNVYNDISNLEEVNSTLYRLLEALIDERISEKELLGYLDSHLLAILTEEVVDTAGEQAFKDLLGKSLVGIQALKHEKEITPLVSALDSTASWIRENVSDEELRQVFASTGLSIESCKFLEQASNSFTDSISLDEIQNDEILLQCDLNLLRVAFNACQNLREMQIKSNITYKGPDDEFELISSWISGLPINQIRSQFWHPDFSEDFSEYIADRIVYKLPWGLNGFVSILKWKLLKRFESIEELPKGWSHLASMVKFGVNNVIACWFCSLGVSSRKLALELASRYTNENQGLKENAFILWFVNLSDNIIAALPGSEYEKQRIRERRNRIIPNREYIDFIRRPNVEIESPLMGIPFDDFARTATKIKEGDNLILELEPNNPYDANAVRVVFENDQVGYVQRSKAQIIARELKIERKVEAYAKVVTPATSNYPYPRIVMGIKIMN